MSGYLNANITKAMKTMKKPKSGKVGSEVGVVRKPVELRNIQETL